MRRLRRGGVLRPQALVAHRLDAVAR